LASASTSRVPAFTQHGLVDVKKKMEKKEQWEEDAKNRFIAELKALGRGDWIVADTDVVVDPRTSRNFDYQLRSGTQLIALEIFRLVETRAELIRQKSWSTIAGSSTSIASVNYTSSSVDS
jgi:hypothetical protein